MKQAERIIRRFDYLDQNPKINTTDINQLREAERAAIDFLFWVGQVLDKQDN